MQKFIKTAVVFLIGYLLLFLVCWFMLIQQAKEPGAFSASNTRSFTESQPIGLFQTESIQDANYSVFSTLDKSRQSMRANYAQELKTVKTGPGAASRSAQQVATYEKVASLGVSSRDFDGDSEKIRSSIQTLQAIVQQEKISGLKEGGII